jgi:hypothetical protein
MHPNSGDTTVAPNTAFSMQFVNVKQITSVESTAQVDLWVKSEHGVAGKTAVQTWTSADIKVGMYNVLYMPAGAALTPSVEYCLTVSAGAVKDENGVDSGAVTCDNWKFTVSCKDTPYPTPALLAYGLSTDLRAQTRAPECDPTGQTAENTAANAFKPCIKKAEAKQTVSLLWSYPIDSLDSTKLVTGSAFSASLPTGNYEIELTFTKDGTVTCPDDWVKFKGATATAQTGTVCTLTAEVANAAFKNPDVGVQEATVWDVAAYAVKQYNDATAQAASYDPTLYTYGYRATADWPCPDSGACGAKLTGTVVRTRVVYFLIFIHP